MSLIRIKYGAKKTIASALGNVTVTLVQASISLAGLGAILVASETLFNLIKWAGAVYLIYTGLSILFSSNPLAPQFGSEKPKRPKTFINMFLQASLVTAGNPKAIVFFTSIFPQFMDLNTAYLLQSCILLGLCAIIAFGCFMIYAIGGQKVVSLFSNAGAGIFLKRVIGGTFIGAGIGMVTSNK